LYPESINKGIFFLVIKKKVLCASNVKNKNQFILPLNILFNLNSVTMKNTKTQKKIRKLEKEYIKENTKELKNLKRNISRKIPKN